MEEYSREARIVVCAVIAFALLPFAGFVTMGRVMQARIEPIFVHPHPSAEEIRDQILIGTEHLKTMEVIDRTRYEAMIVTYVILSIPVLLLFLRLARTFRRNK